MSHTGRNVSAFQERNLSDRHALLLHVPVQKSPCLLFSLSPPCKKNRVVPGMLPAQASLRSPAITPWAFQRAVPSPGGRCGAGCDVPWGCMSLPTGCASTAFAHGPWGSPQSATAGKQLHSPPAKEHHFASNQIKRSLKMLLAPGIH